MSLSTLLGFDRAMPKRQANPFIVAFLTEGFYAHLANQPLSD